MKSKLGIWSNPSATALLAWQKAINNPGTIQDVLHFPSDQDALQGRPGSFWKQNQMILVISRSLQSFLLLICSCEIKAKGVCAQSLTHTNLILNNCFVITETTECCRLIHPKLFHFFTSKVWNYAKLYPLLETTAQKATPFALYCDCLYVCSLRTWVLTAWALRDFALERLLSEQ